MKPLSLLPIAFIAATLTIASPAGQAQASLLQFSTLLGPEAIGATGMGTALVTFDTLANTMRVQTTFSGLSGNTTVAHIHAPTAVPGTGTAGVATPTPSFPGFPAGVTAGTYSNTFDMTLNSSYNGAFITANGGTTTGARNALLSALGSGRAYLNIHTSAFPGGEIRGFFTTVPEPSFLLGFLGLGLLGVGSRFRQGDRH
jgi:CHRD domain/PEP-CTERM motif